MLSSLGNIFKIPELKVRLYWTLFFLAIYRIGCAIPTPGINRAALRSLFEGAGSNVFGMFNLFSGGAFSQMTVCSLGIMPYITASIILQLLTLVVPTLEQLSKEGDAGRRKITQYTRYLTVGIALVQALGISVGLERMEGIVMSPGLSFKLMAMITLCAGTAFIMWLGEQINDRGIGNGISLIIFAGIIAGLPSAVFLTWERVVAGEMQPLVVISIVVLVALVTALTCLMQQGQRKIPVQYARRVVGQKIYGGTSTYIPLKVNTAGVIPVIFAQSLLVFPQTALSFFGTENEWLRVFADAFSPTSPAYLIVYFFLIVLFTYFYTAVIFNPQELAENMKKNGGFIPGIRPGAKTAEFLDGILSKITFWGALFLSGVSIIPYILIAWYNVPFYFGGTALLIVVGVGLDTVQQIESQLVMRHYEGFMGGRSKRRRT